MSTQDGRVDIHVQLPEDVCYLIASHIRRPSDLRSWMLTSRDAYNGGLHHLYHNVRVRFSAGEQEMIYNFCSPDNKGLRHIRHLELLPQTPMPRKVSRWHPEDGTQRFEETDGKSGDRAYRFHHMIHDVTDEKSGDPAYPFQLMIHKILRPIPPDGLLSFSAHKYFSNTAVRLLMRHQTCLEYLHLDSHKPWSASVADRIKPTNLKSLHFPWCELQAHNLNQADGRNLAHLISTNAKLESLTIDHSHHPRVMDTGWNLFWTGMSSLSFCPSTITKLELYRVQLPDDWKQLPLFSSLVALRSLRLVDCEETEDIIAALQTLQTSGSVISLQELFIFAINPRFLGWTFAPVDDGMRAQLGTFLQSFSGLRKLCIYANYGGTCHFPIEISWLLGHASTLEYLDLQSVPSYTSREQQGYISSTKLEELCDTCPNLRQLGIPLFYHHRYEICPMFLHLQSIEWMRILAKLKHLRTLKCIGYPGARALYVPQHLNDDDRERIHGQIQVLVDAYFSALKRHAELLGHRSQVKVIAFTDPSYDCDNVYQEDRRRHYADEHSDIDALIYFKENLSGIVGDDFCKLSSHEDVFRPEDATDLVHWKNLRWSMNKKSNRRENSMYQITQWPIRD
ncbi:hypothetical protein D6D10_02288 [Aureobasidium pullulans]|uniref:Uncharacterized protein n=1 Tax=Aureobasidium pullulans TaxID=5580 RepID=A0A4V4J903_AURPU|nr:hypothetical protein D6D10_02288 [Aureobasidium pullulans]